MTAEFVIVLPAVVLVLAACLGGLAVAGQQLRLQDAAGMAAREAGRSGGAAVAVRLVPGATFGSWSEGDLVCVRVSSAGSLGLLSIPLTATACALDAGR